MNLLECVVTKITGSPKLRHNKWFIPVQYDCYGVIGNTSLMFNSEQECIEVNIGYKFLG